MTDPIRAESAGGMSAFAQTESEEDTLTLGQYKVPIENFDLQMDRPNIPEEFNKKVFTLIEMAQDDRRRAQRHLSWCPWF